MGNCCGKSSSSDDDNFQGQGRTLGAAPTTATPPAANARASVPPPAKTTGPGRTLGSTTTTSTAKQDGVTTQETPNQAAARAAAERAKSAQTGQTKGKLGRQLDAQKALSQADTLAQNARENVAAREADANAQTRNWA